MVLEPPSVIGPFLEDVCNKTSIFRVSEEAKRVTKPMQNRLTSIRSHSQTILKLRIRFADG